MPNPPSQFTGNRGFIAIAYEATFGTYATATDYLTQKSDTLTVDPNNMPVKAFRNTRSPNMAVAPGPTHVKGNIVHEVFPDIGARLAAYAMGTDSISGAGPYTHTLSPNEDGLPSLSIEKSVGAKSFLYAGCLIDKATFKLAVNAPVEATYEIVGQVENQQLASPTSATPTSYSLATAQSPYTLSSTEVKIGIADGASLVADNTINAAEIVIDNGVQLEHTFTLGQRYPNLVYAGDRVITGKLSKRIVNLTDLYTPAVNSTFGSVSFHCTGTFGGVSCTFTIQLNNVQWGEPSVPLVMGKLTIQELPFTAFQTSSSHVDIAMVIINNRSTTYFGT